MRIFRTFIAALFVALVVMAPVYAQALPADIGGAQLQQARQNCRQVQVNLRNLQKQDTVLRINRGRLYDMTLRQTGAFVSRLDVNKIDAPAIKQYDGALRAEYQRFILDYDQYAETLDLAITMDCRAKTEDFYRALGKAAEERKIVAKDVATIKQQLGSYSNELGRLRDERFPKDGEAR